MKSALFVDFDNVYSQLRQLQPEAAERFARQPGEWIGWLTGTLALPEPHVAGQRRRLLVRRCYLNPNWYQSYRHAFLRAGFEVVDCPPVTSQGKTSTDIHMVLDVVELLQHETHYDEFIVFSADADFTPVLRKLRRFDRRTTVLAIGHPSAAYQASADLLIDERLFVQEALGLDRSAPEVADEPARPDAGADVEPPPAGARAATADELAAIARSIAGIVDASPTPVSAGMLALRLKQEFPEALGHWNGHGSFKPFFRSLGLSRLTWLSGSGGRVADPLRHHEADLPAAPDAVMGAEMDATTDVVTEAGWEGRAAMFRTVREVCELTGAPLLAPHAMQTVLRALTAQLNSQLTTPSATPTATPTATPAATTQPGAQPFDLAALVRAVCEHCAEVEGLPVRPRDVAFLLRGLQLNGHHFGQGRDDRPTLAARLVSQMRFLCEREQRVLSESDVALIRAWIDGDAAA